MIAVRIGLLDIVKELDREGTDFFTKDMDGKTLIETARRMTEKARTRRNDYAEVLKYLMERPKVDTLKVNVAHNIARYVRNKADVEAMENPVTLKHSLAGSLYEDSRH